MKPYVYDDLSPPDKKIVRELYIKEQKGLCWYCKGPLDKDPPQRIMKLRLDLSRFPPGMLRYPVHLHHDRWTGLTIGAVHARCNAVLWQYHGE